MSKQYLLKIPGLAALTLLSFSPAFAQDSLQNEYRVIPDNPGKSQNYEEVIIRNRNNKDAKVTIEMKDGQVWVNGKPVSEFDDSTISVRQRKIRIRKDDARPLFGTGEIDESGYLITPDGSPEIREEPLTLFRSHNGSGTQSLTVGYNRAFLGVTSEKPEKEGAGAQVKELSKGSAAEKAGLRPGDLITKVDDITIEDPSALSEAIHKYKPQDKVTLTYKRNGKEEKTPIVLGKSAPAVRSYNYRYDVPNLNFQDHNFDNKLLDQLQELQQPKTYGFSYGDPKPPRLGIKAQDTEDGKGVKVLEVGDESAAEKAGIKEGDIITSFDGKEVNSAVTLAELARVGREKVSIKVGLNRAGKAREIEVKVPKKLKMANL